MRRIARGLLPRNQDAVLRRIDPIASAPLKCSVGAHGLVRLSLCVPPPGRSEGRVRALQLVQGYVKHWAHQIPAAVQPQANGDWSFPQARFPVYQDWLLELESR